MLVEPAATVADPIATPVVVYMITHAVDIMQPRHHDERNGDRRRCQQPN
jgi:hypothetical protein